LIPQKRNRHVSVPASSGVRKRLKMLLQEARFTDEKEGERTKHQRKGTKEELPGARLEKNTYGRKDQTPLSRDGRRESSLKSAGGGSTAPQRIVHGNSVVLMRRGALKTEGHKKGRCDG